MAVWGVYFMNDEFLSVWIQSRYFLGFLMENWRGEMYFVGQLVSQRFPYALVDIFGTRSSCQFHGDNFDRCPFVWSLCICYLCWPSELYLLSVFCYRPLYLHRRTSGCRDVTWRLILAIPSFVASLETWCTSAGQCGPSSSHWLLCRIIPRL